MSGLSLFQPDQQVYMPVAPVRFIGIDLGTTNSTIAEIIWEPGGALPVAARCLEVEQETLLQGKIYNIAVPSMVALFKNKVYIGEGAKELRYLANDYGLRFKRNIFYNCKNEIGTSRKYNGAPPGFRSPSEIGSLVLGFLHQAALRENSMTPSRTVVTVPASFQLAQRQDTLSAAANAGLSLAGGDLLDEPVAAFLDYIISNDAGDILVHGKRSNLVVFDFGGGTCDVAVFELHLADRKSPLDIAPLAVSRYHRLGGSDIDLAVLYEVLLPQLMEQNGLSEFDLVYNDKKEYIEPALLGAAEALKISLCREVRRLKEFGKYDGRDKSTVKVINATTYECKQKNRVFRLFNPEMSAAQFEDLLKPFLDRDCLYARETEYRLILSVFAPLQDALDRSGLRPENIDYCLMVGGSSLIPQVTEAVDKFFINSKLLTYADDDQLITSVARGAAFHAFASAALGNSLVRPVLNESIAIRTSAGLLDLVPKDSSIPYPEGDTWGRSNFVVPRTSLVDDVPLRIEILAGEDERKLLEAIWQIPAPVNQGEPLLLEYRYDANQVLELKMHLIRDDEKVDHFSCMIENPLTNVVNPNRTQLLIDELEDELTGGKVERSQHPGKLAKIAQLLADLGQYEKAIDRLRIALLIAGEADADILNKMATYYGEMGDYDSEEKMYRKAAVDANWPGAWFNLSLVQKRRGRLSDALESVAKAIAKEKVAPYRVLRAMLLEKLGDSSETEEELNEALALFNPIPTLSDWELGWYATALRMAGDTEKLKEVEAEIQRRARSRVGDSDIAKDGELPVYKSTSIDIRRP